MFGLMFIYAIYVRVSIGDFDFFLYPFFYIYINLTERQKCKQEAV